MTGPLICYYADDFTGATDALECLERAGVSTLLLLNAPARIFLPGIRRSGRWASPG